jgi:hypothetical protein
MAPALKLTEKQNTETIIGWLRAQGWMCIRHQSGLLVTEKGGRIRVGSPGAPDWICFKESQYFFLELKATGKKLSVDQLLWFGLAEQRNINAIWADGYEVFLARFKAAPWSKP